MLMVLLEQRSTCLSLYQSAERLLPAATAAAANGGDDLNWFNLHTRMTEYLDV
jgi:hypothetical protein